MIVVSNTSPIVNLAAVGCLDLLRQLYGSVVIPQAVYDEIVIAGAGQPGAVEVRTLDWIKTGSATNLILLDERKGRRAASRLGLLPVGLLGVLVEAKHKRLVPAVKPVIDDLIARASFRIGQELYDRVLQVTGESLICLQEEERWLLFT